MPSVSRSSGKNRLIREFDFEVASSATEDFVLDTLANFKNQKLLVRVTDQVDSRRRVWDIQAVKFASNDINDQLSSKLGDDINLDCNVLVSGSDVVLRVINNDSNTVLVNLIMIKTTS